MQPNYPNPFSPQQAMPTAPAMPAPAPMPVQPAFQPAQQAPAAMPTNAGGLAPGGDEFGAPAQRTSGPRVADLHGRLLLIRPRKLEENLPNRLQPGTFQDRMTVDIVVLDGGPLAFGGRPEDGVPHNKQTNVPHAIKSAFVSQKALVNQMMDAYEHHRRGTGPGLVLGRLTRGQATEPGRKPPWILDNPTEDDKNMARQWIARNPQDPFAAPVTA